VVSIRRPAQPPAFTPAPYGLLSVAQPADDAAEPHWRNGVEFQPLYCGPANNTVPANCSDMEVRLTFGLGEKNASYQKYPLDERWPPRGADPFAVYGWLDCPPAGYSPDEWRALTTSALLNNEQAAVEATFWTGLTPAGPGSLYPHLAANTEVVEGVAGVNEQVLVQTAATVLVTGAVDVVEAMGRLEGAMAGCYGGTPTVHVPRRSVAHMDAWGLVVRDGDRLRSKAGSLVAAGLGYPGTGPDGQQPADPVVWWYATGAVKYWRGPVEYTGRNPAEWVGRATNDQVLIAERAWVLGWDCCHFAVPVYLGGDITGTTSTWT
jgi:hypothetical protein